MADPRSQWSLDAETARLKAQQEAEAKAEARRRREREKADEAEAKRLQRQIEEEEKVARRKQAEVEKETERLRKLYGVPQQPNTSRPSSGGRRYGGSGLAPIPQGRPSASSSAPPPRGSNGLYMQPAASQSVMMSGANPSSSVLSLAPGQKPAKKKSSFFGLRGGDSEVNGNDGRLRKKGSAMW